MNEREGKVTREFLRTNVQAIPEVVALLAERFRRVETRDVSATDGLDLSAINKVEKNSLVEVVLAGPRRRRELADHEQMRIAQLVESAVVDADRNLRLLVADEFGTGSDVNRAGMVDWGRVREALEAGEVIEAMRIAAPKEGRRRITSESDTGESTADKRHYKELEPISAEELLRVGELSERLGLEPREWGTVILRRLVASGGVSVEEDLINDYFDESRVRTRKLDEKDRRKSLGRGVGRFCRDILPKIRQAEGLADIDLGFVKEEVDGQKVIKVVLGRKHTEK